jgi:2-keto-myo-inositol isomerase
MKDKFMSRQLLPALNLVSLLRADVEQGVSAAAQAGFSNVELWVDSLEKYLKAHPVIDLQCLLDEHGIRVSAIGDIESVTFCNRQQFAELRAQCARLAILAREIGCPALVISGSVCPRGLDSAAVSAEVNSVLESLLEITEPQGIGLALAFRGFSWCSVNSLQQAIEAVERCNGRRIGVALDTFDLHAAGAGLDKIRSIPSSRILVARLADCPDISRPLLTDSARLLPGEGKAALPEMLKSIEHAGFSGPVSIKVISPRLLDLKPNQIAHMAMAAAEPYFEHN